MDCKDKVRSLPTSPGVYMMKDVKGSVLYVGKAKSIRKRVASYFKSSGTLRLAGRLESLISQVNDIAYIETTTEAEALIYENSLIKRFSPKYNVELKDDKSYPLLKLTIKEKFPRLFITRIRKDDGSVYFGPYTSVKLLRKAVGFLKGIFPLRVCAKMPRRLCLEYHIGQCLGPCEDKVDERTYRDVVSELRLFLEGGMNELIEMVTEKMKNASRAEDYEEAARLRDRLEAFGAVKETRISYSPARETAELRELLGIKGTLDIIEAFDVSNIMGKEAVGSMIYFYKGRPKKSEYRRFKIRSVFKVDDYSMIREVVNRRYVRSLREKRSLPDLILIDGGRGHLGVAVDELEKLGISDIPVVGIAKEFERIYLKDKKEPLELPKESKALHLLERVRDEAHRFAISYHKGLLSKKVGTSELDSVPYIGKKRKTALIGHFGSVDKVKIAGLEELLKVKGMDEKSAQSLIAYFKR